MRQSLVHIKSDPRKRMAKPRAIRSLSDYDAVSVSCNRGRSRENRAELLKDTVYDPIFYL